jgi:excisionase family DNA binding protein
VQYRKDRYQSNQKESEEISMAKIKIPETRTIDSPVQVYSPDEVAAILKTSTRTVQRLIQKRRLPAFRLGWAYRINGEDLQRFCTASATALPHNPVNVATV